MLKTNEMCITENCEELIEPALTGCHVRHRPCTNSALMYNCAA